jgi:hypothetical protein
MLPPSPIKGYGGQAMLELRKKLFQFFDDDFEFRYARTFYQYYIVIFYIIFQIITGSKGVFEAFCLNVVVCRLFCGFGGDFCEVSDGENQPNVCLEEPSCR